MTSKEYIKSKLEYLTRYEPSLSFDIDMYEKILQDLECLEALKKEKEELKNILDADIKALIEGDRLAKENEKLKQQVEDLENNQKTVLTTLEIAVQKNEKLKMIIKEKFWVFNNDEVLFKFNENIPVMQEKIKEVLGNE